MAARFARFFGQPVTVLVFVMSHSPPGAASALNGPWGRLSSKLPTGASGTVWKALVVMLVSLRLGSAFSGIAPELAATITRKSGANRIAHQLADGQRGKR